MQIVSSTWQQSVIVAMFVTASNTPTYNVW